MKPCLTNKTLIDERITFIENEKVVSDERELKSNIVPNLDIQRPPSIILHHDPVLNAIKKF